VKQEKKVRHHENNEKIKWLLNQVIS